MPFDLENAIEIANQAVTHQRNRPLSDVEILVLRGVWHKLDYDQMAAQGGYATSYLSQDVAPKLWKQLSVALGEKVKKSNFKTTVERYAKRCSNLRGGVSEGAAAMSGDEPTAISPSFLPPSSPPPPSLSSLSPSEQQLGSSSPVSVPRSPSAAPAASPATALTATVPSFVPRVPSFPKALAQQYYIERPQMERLFYEALLESGALVRLKAPRFMGKTTLISRVLAEVARYQCRVVKLSFEMVDRAVHLTDLNKFLRWFCINITRELGLPNRLNEYWDAEDMGVKVSCTAYFEESLLLQSDRPLVLCLDDVDVLFPYPEIYEDFLGLLRSWHEKATTSETWSKLRLVIVHSTDVYIRLNIHQSPFNVGQPFTLPEFNPAQIAELACLYRLDIAPQLCQQLHALLGGHPALLKQFFTHLKSHPTASIPQLLAEAPTESSLFSAHLREQLLALQSAPLLAAAFRQVVTAPKPVSLDPLAVYQLQSLGLIQLSGNQAVPRCQLYQHYFSDRLLLS